MYAIAFDMDIESLRSVYGDPYNNAYAEIRRVLEKHGLTLPTIGGRAGEFILPPRGCPRSVGG